MTAKPESIKLKAQPRANDLRLTDSTVRGVVYGKKQQPISVAAERLDIQRIYSDLGHNVIFDLVIEGETKPVPVLLHDLQIQPNTNKIIHFDLYAVTMDQKIKTEVPIYYEGEAPAQADSDKVINKFLEQLEVEALPADLPEQIVVDISDLAEIGDTKYVSDIKIPSGVVVLNDVDAAVVKVEELQEIAEEEPEAGEEATGSDDEPEGADGASEGGSEDSKATAE